jgi:hypothetical protein
MKFASHLRSRRSESPEVADADRVVSADGAAAQVALVITLIIGSYEPRPGSSSPAQLLDPRLKPADDVSTAETNWMLMNSGSPPGSQASF